jgi:hypothetical protein
VPNPDRLDRDEYDRLHERPSLGDLIQDMKRIPYPVVSKLSAGLEPLQEQRIGELLATGKAPTPLHPAT